MDTSGYFPQLSDDDPLFEIAQYTQLMKTKLDTSVPLNTSDTNWNYTGKLNKIESASNNHFVSLGVGMSRLGTGFAITTNYIVAIPGFVPVGTRPLSTVNGWALMTNSADAPIGVIWWRIATNGDLSFRLESGSTTYATGNKMHLSANWQGTNV